MKNNLVETLVGAAVILVAVFFFTYVYKAAGLSAESDGYVLNAEFDSIGGLPIGADVRLSGIKVGTVTRQALNPETYRAKITFTMDKSVKLPNDSNAKIASEGLLGGYFLALEPGGAEEMLGNNDTIEYTQSSIDLMSLIGKAIFGSTKK